MGYKPGPEALARVMIEKTKNKAENSGFHFNRIDVLAVAMESYDRHLEEVATFEERINNCGDNRIAMLGFEKDVCYRRPDSDIVIMNCRT